METLEIPAGKFKAQCLKLMDEVNAGKHMIVVTKHGKPVARIVPPERNKKRKKPLFGCMKGSGVILGDIVSPMTELWNLPE